MNTLAWVLVSTALISLTAWVGVLTLYLSDDRLEDVLLLLVALAAGALIGGAFLHLLPRAIAEAGTTDTVPLFLWLLAGFCTFYVLEAFIGWHHHHAATHEHEPVTYLVLLSDALHNFIEIQAGNPAVYGGEERDTVRNNRRSVADRLPILNVTCMNVEYYT